MKTRKIIAVLLVSLLALPLAADEVIKNFTEKIYPDESGNVKIKLEISLKSDSNRIFLPFNYPNNTKLVKLGENLIRADIVNIDGVKYIEMVSKNKFDSSQTYSVFLDADKYFDYEKNRSEFGNYNFSYKFINTRSKVIDTYKVYFFLPAKYVVTSITETIPKVKSSNPDFPFELGRIEGLNYVMLKNHKMSIGESSFIKFRFKEEKKSMLLFTVLILIAGAYLVFFRDLIKNKNKK